MTKNPSEAIQMDPSDTAAEQKQEQEKHDNALHHLLPPNDDDDAAYNAHIESLRPHEFPMLTPDSGTTYLDHAGATLYSRTQLDRFRADMLAGLLGNPHSAAAGTGSAREVDGVRVGLLRLFGADPEEFDLVFTANATAAVKLVAGACGDCDPPGQGEGRGFWYGYHRESHTSLVGVREVAGESWCFSGDGEEGEGLLAALHERLGSGGSAARLGLVAYPAQSNLNGRRFPLDWAGRIRRLPLRARTYTLLDAAAYAATAGLDLSDGENAPDFTVLSLCKIFGFPDLGALIVRKAAGGLFRHVKYFGGGTVDMVSCVREQWHVRKSETLHEQLEDGTLPIHSILALKSAMRTHSELFGTLDRVSRHTAGLARRLHDGLAALRHGNGRRVCTIYKHAGSRYGDPRTQGPIVAFNMADSKGYWVSNAEVEKLASIRDLHLRTGGLCNPGGVAGALDLAPWEMRDNFLAGQRCGSGHDILNGKPTGVIRLSLGAMSTISDVQRAVEFFDEFFVDRDVPSPSQSESAPDATDERRYHVESLTVYPIKSCGGFAIPPNKHWEIRPEGLAWDREWCLVQCGSGKALSQKQYPQMALIRPALDLNAGMLRIGVPGRYDTISVPLSRDPSLYEAAADDDHRGRHATVCDERVRTLTYRSPAISEFFSKSIGVECTLARFTAVGERHGKDQLQPAHKSIQSPRPIQFSNESPILTVSRSSLNRLNELIKERGGRAVHPSVFRANIIIAEVPVFPPGREQPWVEDGWKGVRMGGREAAALVFLGGCRRCQMVCVDQSSAEKSPEPFITLAKTRRFDGRVLFGVHSALADQSRNAMVKVGDTVEVLGREDE